MHRAAQFSRALCARDLPNAQHLVFGALLRWTRRPMRFDSDSSWRWQSDHASSAGPAEALALAVRCWSKGARCAARFISLVSGGKRRSWQVNVAVEHDDLEPTPRAESDLVRVDLRAATAQIAEACIVAADFTHIGSQCRRLPFLQIHHTLARDRRAERCAEFRLICWPPVAT